MDDEDHIELAKIGMRYGARIAVALAVFAIGGGLLFTTGGILFSEHPNIGLVFGTVIASLLLICSGIAIVYWSGSQSHDEIDNLRTKCTPQTNDNCKNTIQEKLEALKTLEISDPGLLKASDLHNIVKAQMDLTTSLSDQQHRDIMQLEKYSSRLEKITYGLLVLTGILIILTAYSLIESQHSSELLSTLTKTNDLMLANLYSNYDLKIKYEIDSFNRPGKLGGRMYDLWVTNYGDYDAKVNSTWYVNDVLCNINGSHMYIDRIKSMSNSVTHTDILARKSMASYILEIPRIYPNYTNLKPFTIELVAEGIPVTPDKTPISYFTKTKIARVQFVYNDTIQDWSPQLGWNNLDCYAKSPNNYNLQLDTSNLDQFRDTG